MPDQNNDSKMRTRWAEDRTILANERTFSAWMGLGLLALPSASRPSLVQPIRPGSRNWPPAYFWPAPF